MKKHVRVFRKCQLVLRGILLFVSYFLRLKVNMLLHQTEQYLQVRRNVQVSFLERLDAEVLVDLIFTKVNSRHFNF